MIKIIDYKAGNAPSVMHAVTQLGYNAAFARSPEDLFDAGYIILPGVGSAKATMESLARMDMIDALKNAVQNKKVLFLGICVGMQILFEHSEEENTPCLGWLKGPVVRFDAKNVRVPQMGWNKVSFVKHAPFKAVDDFFYFVNSYYANPANKSDIWGITEYNGLFASAVCSGNIYGVQFHVEKSSEAGLSLLSKFLRLKTESKECLQND